MIRLNFVTPKRGLSSVAQNLYTKLVTADRSSLAKAITLGKNFMLKLLMVLITFFDITGGHS
jgi:hypothetical protein